MIHGEEEDLLKALINSNYYDVVIHGHTHKAEKYVVGKTLVINPGEVCGYLTGKTTMAVLNVDEREAEIIDIA